MWQWKKKINPCDCKYNLLVILLVYEEFKYLFLNWKKYSYNYLMTYNQLILKLYKGKKHIKKLNKNSKGQKQPNNLLSIFFLSFLTLFIYLCFFLAKLHILNVVAIRTCRWDFQNSIIDPLEIDIQHAFNFNDFSKNEKRHSVL